MFASSAHFFAARTSKSARICYFILFSSWSRRNSKIVSTVISALKIASDEEKNLKLTGQDNNCACVRCSQRWTLTNFQDGASKSYSRSFSRQSVTFVWPKQLHGCPFTVDEPKQEQMFTRLDFANFSCFLQVSELGSDFGSFLWGNVERNSKKACEA